MKDMQSANRQQDDMVFITNTTANRPGSRNNQALLGGATSNRGNNVFRSQCNDIELSRNGEVTVVYNTSCYTVFTIFVINNNSSSITGYSQVSPDAIHFKTEQNSFVTIEPDEVEIFVGRIFANYTSIILCGPPYGHVRIYIQGQLA